MPFIQVAIAIEIGRRAGDCTGCIERGNSFNSDGRETTGSTGRSKRS